MISILLTSYNDAKSLPKAVKSVLLQSYKNYELLIIDDGSNDDTQNVIEKFSDNRIRYVKIEHRGRSGALNYGLKIAKYDWVFLLDADDILLPFSLEKYSRHISTDTNLVISSFCCFYNQKKILFCLDYPITDNEIKNFLLLHSFNNTVLYNRNYVIRGLNGYNESLNESEEDYDLWLRGLHTLKYKIIPEYLVIKGFSYNSFSMRRLERKRECVYKLQQKFYESFNHKTIELSIEKLAWREFFYGNRMVARKHLFNLKYQVFSNWKMLLAVLLSYISQRKLNKILRYNLYRRLVYRLKYFNKDLIIIRSFLSEFQKINKIYQSS